MSINVRNVPGGGPEAQPSVLRPLGPQPICIISIRPPRRSPALINAGNSPHFSYDCATGFRKFLRKSTFQNFRYLLDQMSAISKGNMTYFELKKTFTTSYRNHLAIYNLVFSTLYNAFVSGVSIRFSILPKYFICGYNWKSISSQL